MTHNEIEGIMTQNARSSYASHKLDLRESRLTKLLHMLGEETPGRLLDIGCGGGELASLLAGSGWEVEGLEREPTQVGAARGRGLVVHATDFGCDPFPCDSDSFDVVIAGEVIEHVIDTDHFLQEIGRVLKPQGTLVITTPNLASLENRVRLFFGRYPMWMDHRVEGTGHLRYYTPRILRKQLEEHGFKVILHLGNWVPFVPQQWMDDRKAPWLSATGNWWPTLAMDILMKAKLDRTFSRHE